MPARIFLQRLCLLAVLLLIRPARAADDDWTVLKDPAARKMLSEYLAAQTKIQFEARSRAVAGIQTPEALQKRQEELKGRFIAALGGFPAKTPLNAKVVGTVQSDGFTVERIIYESRPNHHITANLYLPAGKGPFPAVLVPCGHTSNGKIGYQRVCALLAKNGIAALCYDPIGQGERYQILDPPGKPFTGSTNEHTLVGIGAMLVGECTASYRVWDGIRSLDYLCSRPEIDPKRIGCTGSSGGGTLTSYLMALDDRILAAAPSCYLTTLERLFATRGPQDGEQNIPGQVAFGMDHADYVTMRAPRPTLILCATGDFFDINGTWTTFREAKRLYGVAGFGERVDLFEYNTPHGYPKQQREAMLRFMKRWLQGKDEPLTEGDLPTFKAEQLTCTRTGQVLEDLKGRSAFDFIADKEKQLAAQRAKFLASAKLEDVHQQMQRLLALPPSRLHVRAQPAGEPIQREGYVIHRLVFETEPGIKVPALLCGDQGKGNGPLVVYLHEAGKAADAAPGGPIEKLVRAGNRVLALDVRGVGETAPAPLPAKPTFFGNDYREAFLGIHLNRPLLGQRLADVLAILGPLAREQKDNQSELRIVGIGTGGLLALHAAVLEPRLQQVTIERSLVSWSAVTRSPITYGQLTNVVPGVLQVYDLPDLAALIAPRPLTILHPLDAQQKPVTQAALEAAYAGCKAAYARQNAAKQLTLKAQ